MIRKYKITIIILVALMIAVSYLFISITSNKGKIEAISKTKSAAGFNEYPSKPGKVNAMLGMGGPEPKLIPGELETKVNFKSNGIYQVTFIEHWNSSDFKYQGSKEGIQSHFTTYEVKGDTVNYIKNGGDFPPYQAK